jgi:murein DD-endopeptidase MepM/ murein hydrolase activator NlpD
MSLPENFSYSKVASGLGNIGKATKRARERFTRNPQDFSGVTNLIRQSFVKPPAPATPGANVSVRASNYSPSASASSGKPFRLGVVTTPYGGSTRYEKFHPGIDIANDIGTPIPSFTSGRVTEVRTGEALRSGKGYGNYIIVTDRQGNRHRYSHLHNSFVRVGQEVNRGTVLGGMSATGAAYSTSGGTGSHLDYRVKNAYDKYVNPESFLYGR